MSAELITIVIAVIAMGLTIVGIQMTTFIYLLRRMDERMDTLQRYVGEVRRDVGELAERVSRIEGIIGRQEIGNGTVTQSGDD